MVFPEFLAGGSSGVTPSEKEGNFSWNDLNPDDQVMIGLALLKAAEVRPDMRTREELDDIARFVRLAQRRNAAQKKERLGAASLRGDSEAISVAASLVARQPSGTC